MDFNEFKHHGQMHHDIINLLGIVVFVQNHLHVLGIIPLKVLCLVLMTNSKAMQLLRSTGAYSLHNSNPIADSRLRERTLFCCLF